MRAVHHFRRHLVLFLLDLPVAFRHAALERRLGSSKFINVFEHKKKKVVGQLEEVYLWLVDGKRDEVGGLDEEKGDLQKNKKNTQLDSKMINVYLYFIYKMNSSSPSSSDSSNQPSSPMKKNPHPSLKQAFTPGNFNFSFI